MGRAIFRQTMWPTRFEDLAAKLRFDDWLTRPHRKCQGKLAPIAALWQKWESQLARFSRPGKDIQYVLMSSWLRFGVTARSVSTFQTSLESMG